MSHHRPQPRQTRSFSHRKPTRFHLTIERAISLRLDSRCHPHPDRPRITHLNVVGTPSVPGQHPAAHHGLSRWNSPKGNALKHEGFVCFFGRLIQFNVNTINRWQRAHSTVRAVDRQPRSCGHAAHAPQESGTQGKKRRNPRLSDRGPLVLQGIRTGRVAAFSGKFDQPITSR